MSCMCKIISNLLDIFLYLSTVKMKENTETSNEGILLGWELGDLFSPTVPETLHR